MSITELRKFRIFDIAIFDLVTSILGMILAFIVFWKIHFSKLPIYKFILAAVILSIPFGVIIHIIFGVNTNLNYKLGLSYKPNK
jgi:hypothetical protein